MKIYIIFLLFFLLIIYNQCNYEYFNTYEEILTPSIRDVHYPQPLKKLPNKITFNESKYEDISDRLDNYLEFYNYQEDDKLNQRLLL